MTDLMIQHETELVRSATRLVELTAGSAQGTPAYGHALAAAEYLRTVFNEAVINPRK